MTRRHEWIPRDCGLDLTRIHTRRQCLTMSMPSGIAHRIVPNTIESVLEKRECLHSSNRCVLARQCRKITTVYCKTHGIVCHNSDSSIFCTTSIGSEKWLPPHASFCISYLQGVATKSILWTSFSLPSLHYRSSFLLPLPPRFSFALPSRLATHMRLKAPQ